MSKRAQWHLVFWGGAGALLAANAYFDAPLWFCLASGAIAGFVLGQIASGVTGEG